MTPVGLAPKVKVFEVVGIFDSGMYEFDSNLTYITLKVLRTFSISEEV